MFARRSNGSGIARHSNGDRMSAIAGLELALQGAEREVRAAVKQKGDLPTLLAVAEYNRDRLHNKNKPEIRRLASVAKSARSRMDEIFVLDDEDDDAYEKYMSLREQADEADRLRAVLEAEVRKVNAVVENRLDQISNADQQIANAEAHRDCIKATLEEALLERANVPEEYRNLVRIVDSKHGRKSVCIARQDIPGACIVFHVSDGRSTNASDFMEQINLLRRRDEQDEMLAAD